MKKEIYSPMEEVLIKGTLAICGDDAQEEVKPVETKDLTAAALETKKKTTSLLELDELLLKMEAQQDMMDGMRLEVYL